MLYELALISVVIGAGYWGLFFARRRPHGTSTFGLMLLGAAAASGLGLVGRQREDAGWLGVAGAIGVGAGLCLLVVGPIARGLARRMVAAERMWLAARLFDLAELLSPGSGVAEEKAVVRAMLEIREGRIEQTVEALRAARQRAPAEALRAIDERIAMLYLTAYRWREAIAYAEEHLFTPAPPDEEDGPVRRALGVAPPVWVELIGAYGRVGDLPRAAELLERLEAASVGDLDAGVWLVRARMIFLAFAGQVEAVRALAATDAARAMTAVARRYWLGLAHDQAGQAEAAVAAYRRARRRARGRPRAMIDEALARLAAGAEHRAIELTPEVRALASRVAAAPTPAVPKLERGSQARATWALTAALLAVSAVTTLAVGDTSDVGVLIRSGAQARGMIADGQWWRLVSCVFVHVGVVHLVLNASGLVVLGRLAEGLFGASRLVAIFGAAGVAGSAASFLASPAGLSAGASGAVFGVLGAVFFELTLHRARYRAAWKRGMWGGLAVVTVGQLGYGFLYPVVDQWAHVAGLAAGGALGFVLSPTARWQRAANVLGRALALAFVGAAAVAAVFVVRTPLVAGVFPSPTAERVVDGIAITVPASWKTEPQQVFQPDGAVVVLLGREATSSAPDQARWIESHRRRAHDALGALSVARASLVVLPPGWEGAELEAAPEDDLGYRQQVRLVLARRAFGASWVLVAIEAPESVVRAGAAQLTAILASIGTL